MPLCPVSGDISADSMAIANMPMNSSLFTITNKQIYRTEACMSKDPFPWFLSIEVLQEVSPMAKNVKWAHWPQITNKDGRSDGGAELFLCLIFPPSPNCFLIFFSNRAPWPDYCLEKNSLKKDFWVGEALVERSSSFPSCSLKVHLKSPPSSLKDSDWVMLHHF